MYNIEARNEAISGTMKNDPVEFGGNKIKDPFSVKSV